MHNADTQTQTHTFIYVQAHWIYARISHASKMCRDIQAYAAYAYTIRIHLHASMQAQRTESLILKHTYTHAFTSMHIPLLPPRPRPLHPPPHRTKAPSAVRAVA